MSAQAQHTPPTCGQSALNGEPQGAVSCGLSVVVYRGADPILVVPEESRVRMPPGVEFTWTPIMCGMDAVRDEWSRAIAVG